jgi:single-strand DNA-binding protein
MAEYRVPSVNKIFITGNLTTDPDLRYMPDGRAVCTFQIASSRRYKSKDTGEWVDAPTTFVRVVSWGVGAERLGERLRKGMAVFVEGRLQSRSWETPEGEKRNIIEINALQVQNLTKIREEVEETKEEEFVVEESGEEEPKESEKEGLPFNE